MTKIVVAVKYVPDATANRTFSSDNTVDREGVDGLLSELDEYAVEQALQVVEAGEGEVTVLTVGPADAADAVRKALQMGATSGVHVQDDSIAGSDAFATSLVLAKAIEKLDYDGDSSDEETETPAPRDHLAALHAQARRQRDSARSTLSSKAPT